MRQEPRRATASHLAGRWLRSAGTTIADLFRSKWKHSDPFVRLAIVEQLTDESLLIHIAESDADTRVRLASINRLTNDIDKPPVSPGTPAWTRLLVAVGAIDQMSSYDERKAALAKITNQSLIAEAARTAESVSTRAHLVEQLCDEQVLASIVCTERWSFVRDAALSRISNQHVLAEIARAPASSFASAMSPEPNLGPCVLCGAWIKYFMADNTIYDPGGSYILHRLAHECSGSFGRVADTREDIRRIRAQPREKAESSRARPTGEVHIPGKTDTEHLASTINASAVKRLTDQRVLAEIATTHWSAPVRVLAVEQLAIRKG